MARIGSLTPVHEWTPGDRQDARLLSDGASRVRDDLVRSKPWPGRRRAETARTTLRPGEVRPVLQRHLRRVVAVRGVHRFLVGLEVHAAVQEAEPHRRAVRQRDVVRVAAHVADRGLAHARPLLANVIVPVVRRVVVEPAPMPLDRLRDGLRVRREQEHRHVVPVTGSARTDRARRTSRRDRTRSPRPNRPRPERARESSKGRRARGFARNRSLLCMGKVLSRPKTRDPWGGHRSRREPSPLVRPTVRAREIQAQGSPARADPTARERRGRLR